MQERSHHDRQLPQHVRRVRVRVPVPAVFMFQGSIMRALSLAFFASCLGVVFTLFRDLFNPDVSPFFPLLYEKKERSQSLCASPKKTTPPDQKSSFRILLLLHHRRSKCTKSRPKSSADGASIGSSWPRLPCLNASRMPFCSSCPCTTRRKSRSSCTCGTQNRKARCTSTINSSDQRCRNTKDRSIEKSKTCKRNLETGASRTRGWRTRTYRR